MMGTATLTDIQKSALLAHRAALVALLPTVVEFRDIRAGAVQYLGALEDTLGMERTVPRRDERGEERRLRIERGKELGIPLRDMIE